MAAGIFPFGRCPGRQRQSPENVSLIPVRRWRTGNMEMKDPGKDSDRQIQTATLAGGCFWCLDGVFRDVEGVLTVKSGYTGGTVSDPS